jgi:branched-chain amino acid transport system ATP-binding protein
LLDVSHVSKRFGGLEVINDISFTIGEGEIVGLVGPNGSGKTTMFNMITGFLRPNSGQIIFNGKNITGAKPHKICRLGIGRTFQIVKPFKDMSVLDNVLVGHFFGNIDECGSGPEEQCCRLLKTVDLIEKKDTKAKDLGLGELRALELCRTLATNPKLLLLDELLAGLNPKEIDDILVLIRHLKKEWGMSIFIVEHVMRAIMSVSDRVIVIHEGSKIFEGTPQEVSQSKEVIEAYLGRRSK